MTDTTLSLSPAEKNDAMAGSRAGLQREMLAWVWLSIGALAAAGLFAILLALSRMPGIERVFSWPLGFFAKGLVIHVIFSLIVWLLGVLAFLATFATHSISGDQVRLSGLGQLGLVLVVLAFPCLAVPAFFDSTIAELVNYVPLIRHPAYDAGLLLLAGGILGPVLRLFANLPQRKGELTAAAVGASSAGFVFVLALSCFAIAAAMLARTGALEPREQLFWGGGHILEFGYTLVMMTNWMILARQSFGERVVDTSIFRLAVILVAVFSIPGPLFYQIFEPFSDRQHEAFRLLQFVLALPTMLFAVSLLAAALKISHPSQWPWRNPAFISLVMSLVLFAAGGIMGFLISSSDTRTPAHYHAMVTAISVSGMGLLLTFAVSELRRTSASARIVGGLILLYGCGQLFASIGMFLAGGYGAPRKTPTVAGSLVDMAAAGMFLHGIGALFAIIGGAAFVVVAFLAFRRPDPARSGA